MKIIDRYILGKFLGTFVYSIGLIISIAIIFDISENIEDFIDKKAPLGKIAFDYYLNFIPYFANLFSPLFTFISVIFFTSKMASNTEIVAILNGGVNFRRLLLPYMVGATLICFASLYLGNMIIPKCTKIKLEFEEIYIRNKFRFSEHNIHRQINPGTFVYFESYDNTENVGFKFCLEKYKKGKLFYKINADFLRWDSIKKSWKIENYHARTINNMKEYLYFGSSKDTSLNLKPQDFSRRINSIETMNYKELNDYIEQEKLRGNENIIFAEIEYYKRFAMPFATYILTLIGVSVASRKVRGGIGMHIGFGLLISFSYILLMQFTTTFATYSNLNPLIAVWLPNIIYTFLSLLLIRIAPK